MTPYYYFVFTNDDPMQTAYKESEISIEEMKKRFVGDFIQTGDEPHDISRVSDIWTEKQAKAYFND